LRSQNNPNNPCVFLRFFRGFLCFKDDNSEDIGSFISFYSQNKTKVSWFFTFSELYVEIDLQRNLDKKVNLKLLLVNQIKKSENKNQGRS